MTFSNEWDGIYKDNSQLSIWPWSDLVSLVHRNCKSIITRRDGKVLELGCGAGANIPLFISLNLNYHAVEGSKAIVERLKKKFPEIENNIVSGDFTLGHSFGNDFDLIFDRASITHNSTKGIKSTLKIIADSLKPGGLFIGSDWFSTNHSDFNHGSKIDDEFTKTNFTSGQFSGVGKVHFSTKEHIIDLFSDFEVLLLEEKNYQQKFPYDDHCVGLWNIVAKRLG